MQCHSYRFICCSAAYSFYAKPREPRCGVLRYGFACAESSAPRLSELFPGFNAGGTAPLDTVAAWIADSLRQDSDNMMAGAKGSVLESVLCFEKADGQE